jgi:hypothetical protein
VDQNRKLELRFASASLRVINPHIASTNPDPWVDIQTFTCYREPKPSLRREPNGRWNCAASSRSDPVLSVWRYMVYHRERAYCTVDEHW